MIYIIFRHYREDLYYKSSRDPEKYRPSWFSNSLCFFSLLDSIRESRIGARFTFIIWYDGSEGDFETDPLIKVARTFSDKISIKFFRENFRDIGDNRSERLSGPALLQFISTHLPDEDYCYLVENDYLHSPDFGSELLSVLEKSMFDNDYLTFYDSPDYYRLPIHKKFIGETFFTENYKWREVLNSTGTYFSRVKVLREDLGTLLSYQDFDAFNRLVGLKGRRLWAPTKALSSHCMNDQDVDFKGKEDVIRRYYELYSIRFAGSNGL